MTLKYKFKDTSTAPGPIAGTICASEVGTTSIRSVVSENRFATRAKKHA